MGVTVSVIHITLMDLILPELCVEDMKNLLDTVTELKVRAVSLRDDCPRVSPLS